MRLGRTCFAPLAAAAIFATAWSGAGAEPGRHVQIPHGDLTLNGWFNEAKDSPATILMLHGTLAHANMEIMVTLAEVFAEYGVETLRVTLSLGQDDRRGMFDCGAVHRHAHADAIGELHAWMAWLQQNGRDSVVLLGHSRATNQVSRYAAHSDEVMGLVLVAPGTWTPGASAARFASQGGGELAPLMAKAEAMIKAGRNDDTIGPITFLHCDDATLSARSLAGYYADDPLFDTFALVEGAGLPAIILTGTEDRLSDGVEDAVAGLESDAFIEHVSIDGADHFFRDLYAYDVVEAVQAWLEKLRPR